MVFGNTFTFLDSSSYMYMPWIGCCFLFIVANLTLLFSGVIGNHAKDFSNILASAKIWVFDDAVSNMIDAVSNMIDAVSNMIDVVSNMVDVGLT